MGTHFLRASHSCRGCIQCHGHEVNSGSWQQCLKFLGWTQRPSSIDGGLVCLRKLTVLERWQKCKLLGEAQQHFQTGPARAVSHPVGKKHRMLQESGLPPFAGSSCDVRRGLCPGRALQLGQCRVLRLSNVYLKTRICPPDRGMFRSVESSDVSSISSAKGPRTTSGCICSRLCRCPRKMTSSTRAKSI